MLVLARPRLQRQRLRRERPGAFDTAQAGCHPQSLYIPIRYPAPCHNHARCRPSSSSTARGPAAPARATPGTRSGTTSRTCWGGAPRAQQLSIRLMPVPLRGPVPLAQSDARYGLVKTYAHSVERRGLNELLLRFQPTRRAAGAPRRTKLPSHPATRHRRRRTRRRARRWPSWRTRRRARP